MMLNIPPRPRAKKRGEGGQVATAILLAIVISLTLGIILVLGLVAALGNGCDSDNDDTPPPCDEQAWYPDADNDDFGDANAQAIYSCSRPTGYVCDATDCDDRDPTINARAAEICDTGLDENCDGLVDAIGQSRDTYKDADGDGYGDPESTAEVDAYCGTPAEGYADSSDDCDDSTDAVSPAAGETRDGIDQDCDGLIDDGAFNAAWLGSEGLLGTGLAGLGDVNGDGHDDLLMAADRASGKGEVYLLLGRSDAPVSVAHAPTAAVATLTGETTAGLAGEELVHLGDLNGDGAADFAVGAPAYCGADCGGRAYLFYGNTGGTRWVGDANLSVADMTFTADGLAQLGAAITATDLDGDGFLDLVLGAPGTTHNNLVAIGAIHIFYGDGQPRRGALTVSDADATVIGSTAAAFFGLSLASVGDIDQDGIPDLAIGAPGDSASGRGNGSVFILHGGARLSGEVFASSYAYEVTGPNEGSLFGAAITGGDVDNDGLPDVVVGAPGACYGVGCPGAVYVAYGKNGRQGHDLTTSEWAELTFQINRTLSFFGTALTVADLSGDGLNDLAIGAPGWGVADVTGGGVFAAKGQASRLRGTVTLPPEAVTFIGLGDDGQAGASLSTASLGDGEGDSLLIGAPGTLSGAGQVLAIDLR